MEVSYFGITLTLKKLFSGIAVPLHFIHLSTNPNWTVRVKNNIKYVARIYSNCLTVGLNLERGSNIFMTCMYNTIAWLYNVPLLSRLW